MSSQKFAMELHQFLPKLLPLRAVSIAVSMVPSTCVSSLSPGAKEKQCTSASWPRRPIIVEVPRQRMTFAAQRQHRIQERSFHQELCASKPSAVLHNMSETAHGVCCAAHQDSCNACSQACKLPVKRPEMHSLRLCRICHSRMRQVRCCHRGLGAHLLNSDKRRIC